MFQLVYCSHHQADPKVQKGKIKPQYSPQMSDFTNVLHKVNNVHNMYITNN